MSKLVINMEKLKQHLESLNVVVAATEQPTENQIVLDYAVTVTPQLCQLTVIDGVVTLKGHCTESDAPDVVVFQSIGYDRERTIARMVAVLMHGDSIRLIPD